MRADTLREFRDVVTARFGWRLDDDRGQLADLIAARLRPGQSPEQYVATLGHAPADEIRALAEALAVSETYFFRNTEQFAALSDVALPERIRANPAGPIRILSAGSASGEEAYSIAMVAHLLRERQPVPPIEILGVDISPRVLAKARAGRYSRWALRGLPESLRAHFFRDHDGHFELRREIASGVRFEERNLLQPGVLAADGRWDIVFFRNTCMYFTPDAARAIVTSLADVMAPGAFLFLGHAEHLRGIADGFELRHTHQTFYYTLGSGGARGAAADAAWPLPALPADGAAALHPTPDADDAWFHEIARASERVAALIDRRDPAPAPPAATRTVPLARPLSAVLSLLEQERYEEALTALGSGGDADRLLLRAVLLLHLGRLDEARAACGAVLTDDATEAGAHYVLALCEERAGHLARAVAADEMAIHLDDTFAMPHLHLGLLARRRQDGPAAARHLRKAHALLQREDDARLRLFGGGFSRLALLRLSSPQLTTPVSHER